MTKRRRLLLAVAALVVLVGVNVLLWLPPGWHNPAVAILEMRGGKVTNMTLPGYEGRVGVTLAEGVTDDDLEHMRCLDWLRPVGIQIRGGSVGNRGLAALTRFGDLYNLSLFGTKVDDDGLAHLSAFAGLEILNLDGCPITDRGLARLQELPQLKVVSLWGTQISPSGAQKLQAARRGLRVSCQFTEPDD
jgi:hypothetical protein